MSADMSKATDAQIQAQFVKDGNEITRLRAERAELLEALREIADILDCLARAALAKAEAQP